MPDAAFLSAVLVFLDSNEGAVPALSDGTRSESGSDGPCRGSRHGPRDESGGDHESDDSEESADSDDGDRGTMDDCSDNDEDGSDGDDDNDDDYTTDATAAGPSRQGGQLCGICAVRPCGKRISYCTPCHSTVKQVSGCGAVALVRQAVNELGVDAATPDIVTRARELREPGRSSPSGSHFRGVHAPQRAGNGTDDHKRADDAAVPGDGARSAPAAAAVAGEGPFLGVGRMCSVCEMRPRTNVAYCLPCSRMQRKISGRGSAPLLRQAVQELGADAAMCDLVARALSVRKSGGRGVVVARGGGGAGAIELPNARRSTRGRDRRGGCHDRTLPDIAVDAAAVAVPASGRIAEEKDWRAFLHHSALAVLHSRISDAGSVRLAGMCDARISIWSHEYGLLLWHDWKLRVEVKLFVLSDRAQ